MHRQIKIIINMKVLDLSLTYHWYDEIAAGRKKEEYRTYNQYYYNRLCYAVLQKLDGTFEDCFKPYHAVRFHRGQGSRTTMLVKCLGITIGLGIPELGAPVGKKVFIIKLGDIITEK